MSQATSALCDLALYFNLLSGRTRAPERRTPLLTASIKPLAFPWHGLKPEDVLHVVKVDHPEE